MTPARYLVAQALARVGTPCRHVEAMRTRLQTVLARVLRAGQRHDGGDDNNEDGGAHLRLNFGLQKLIDVRIVP